VTPEVVEKARAQDRTAGASTACGATSRGAEASRRCCDAGATVTEPSTGPTGVGVPYGPLRLDLALPVPQQLAHVSRADFDGDRIRWFPSNQGSVAGEAGLGSVADESAGAASLAGSRSSRGALRRSAGLGASTATDPSREIAGFAACEYSNSTGGMSPSAPCSRAWLKPADVFDDRELELGASPPNAVGDQLGLEGVDDALGQRVIEGVADGADRRQHAVVVEDLGEG
jgi:hypothetical protein